MYRWLKSLNILSLFIQSDVFKILLFFVNFVLRRFSKCTFWAKYAHFAIVSSESRVFVQWQYFFSSESPDRGEKVGRNFYRQHLGNFYLGSHWFTFSQGKSWYFGDIWTSKFATSGLPGGHKNTRFGKFRAPRCFLHLDLLS